MRRKGIEVGDRDLGWLRVRRAEIELKLLNGMGNSHMAYGQMIELNEVEKEIFKKELELKRAEEREEKERRRQEDYEKMINER